MSWHCARCGTAPTAVASYRGQRCPGCGGPLEPTPHPEDALAFTCPACGAAVDASARGCGACGHSSGPSTATPCPACGQGLLERELGGAVVLECPGCEGVMLSGVLVRDWTAHRASAAPEALPPAVVAPAIEPVRYRRCPRCADWMHRTNFGPGSGVIVDTCLAHGTFFDAGELARVVDFARRGGLERARRRKQEEAESLARDRAREAAQPQATAMLMRPVRGGGDAVLAGELLREFVSWLIGH